jgi:6-pyruvoyltetrahydropterin/6-carboxytetrahydropterin synthase
MPRAQICVRAEFCAAFRLAIEGASDAENRAAFGVCFSPNYHGHNYLLEVTVEGEVDARTGMVADYARIDAMIQEQLIDPVDHRNLNTDVDFLQGVVPTSENLCIAFWPRLQDALPAGLRLMRLRLQESRDHEVVYEGG